MPGRVRTRDPADGVGARHASSPRRSARSFRAGGEDPRAGNCDRRGRAAAADAGLRNAGRLTEIVRQADRRLAIRRQTANLQRLHHTASSGSPSGRSGTPGSTAIPACPTMRGRYPGVPRGSGEAEAVCGGSWPCARRRMARGAPCTWGGQVPRRCRLRDGIGC